MTSEALTGQAHAPAIQVRRSLIGTILLAIVAGVILIGGALLVLGGIRLAQLGGSLYYLPAGVALVAASIQLLRGHRSGLWIYLAVLLVTWLWGFWEVGLDGWALMPRVAALTILGLALLPFYRRLR